MSSFIIPPIGTKGTYEFLAPYDTLINNRQEFEVVSVRYLTDLDNSEEKPFENIYKPVGLTDADFQDDVINRVPILVLATKAGDNVSIPADRISSMPKIDGVKYRDINLVIGLGGLRTTADLTTINEILKQDIYDILGIETVVNKVYGSGLYYLSKEEDATYEQLRANKTSVDKSYRTRYLEALETIKKKDDLINNLEDCIKTNNCV